MLLSLVRSNPHGNIGFLEVENRVCVAISRAQRGFYLFGDGPNLCSSSMLWWYVIRAMAKNPCRVGFYMHLTVRAPFDLFLPLLCSFRSGKILFRSKA